MAPAVGGASLKSIRSSLNWQIGLSQSWLTVRSHWLVLFSSGAGYMGDLKWMLKLDIYFVLVTAIV